MRTKEEDRYDDFGVDIDGFDRDGYNIYTRTKYDPFGIDQNGCENYDPYN